MPCVKPCLWFQEGAEAAAAFYVSLLPDSRIDRVTRLPAETPSGPPGSVVLVDFTLAGRPYSAMEAKGPASFNHAVSFMIACDSQAEIDRLWDAIADGGGTPEECGWISDRWGVQWQITPRRLLDLIADPDRDKARRATEAMLTMTKLDLATIERAAADAG